MSIIKLIPEPRNSRSSKVVTRTASTREEPDMTLDDSTMTADEQKEYVAELTEFLASRIGRAIDAGKIPDTWNSIELRWLCVGMAELTGYGRPDKKSDRYKAFAKICRERFLV